MNRQKTLLIMLTVATLSVLGLAIPSPASAAVSCYGGAIDLNYRYQAAPRDYGPYYTSARCNDVNVRLTTDVPGVYLLACVVFVNHTNQCNRENTYSIVGPPWTTPATDVLDGTKFVLRVGPYDTDAQNVNFKLAY